jgi:hypothetical protein
MLFPWCSGHKSPANNLASFNLERQPGQRLQKDTVTAPDATPRLLLSPPASLPAEKCIRPGCLLPGIFAGLVRWLRLG